MRNKIIALTVVGVITGATAATAATTASATRTETRAAPGRTGESPDPAGSPNPPARSAQGSTDTAH